jgi:hypothetical protein
VTPFDAWYAANIEANLPADIPPQLAHAGKAQAAKVWNAALQAVATHQHENGPETTTAFSLRVLRVNYL